jgi:hypothetical protein
MYFDYIHQPLLSPYTLPPPVVPSPPQLFLFYIHVIYLGIDSTYKRKHVIFVFPSLAYFVYHDDFPAKDKILFFMDNTPLFVCVCIYYIFFIHLLLLGT